MVNTGTGTDKFLEGVKFIDLFAGIGAFRLALTSFGAECVFSSEIDKNACDIYEKNYNERPSGDITKIDAKEIPSHDILCAGFPCQPFSIAGKKEGFNDIKGTLFFDISRIIRAHKPKIVILENVRNFLSHDSGRTFSIVKHVLEGMGYIVYAKLLNAAEYGIPQVRRRVFIICIRKEMQLKKQFSFPEPIELSTCLHDVLEEDEYIPEDLYIDNNPTMKFNALTGKEKTNELIRIGKINSGRQGERIYSDRGCAATLSASGGGPGSTTGMYLINERVRRLTARECARLMGFPEDFKLSPHIRTSYRQFGNSAVIDVIQYIILSIMSSIIKSSLNE